MIDKETVEEELWKFDGSNQQFYFVGLPFVISKGVAYVVETLNFPALLKFVKKIVEHEQISISRLIHGGKNLLIMEVTEKGCELTFYIGDDRAVTSLVDDRPEFPKVRIAMILKADVLYLFNED